MTDDRTLLLDDALGHADRHDAVVVIFQHTEHDIGWRAHVHSSDGACLLSFPWTDQIDRQLVQHSEHLPFGAGLDDVWADVDQGWFGEVLGLTDEVFVAETFDDGWSPGLQGVPTVQPDAMGRQGHVRVNSADVRVSAVPRVEWDRAWNQARSTCLAGSPHPTVLQWTDTEAHQNE